MDIVGVTAGLDGRVRRIVESLRYRNADAMKNAMVEEGLGGAYGVRGRKIKLRICFECQQQRELFS